MRNISHAAMARILQSAVAECTIVTPIKCIIRYAETLSTVDIPDNILDREDFQRYKAMIDLAAERSTRARAAAARRKASMQQSESSENPKPSELHDDSPKTKHSESSGLIKTARKLTVKKPYLNNSYCPAPRHIQLGVKSVKIRTLRPRPRSRLYKSPRQLHRRQ